MPLSDEESRFYRKTLETTQRQLEEIDEQIEEELAQVKERLAELQEKRKNAVRMYEVACSMLGIDNETDHESVESSVQESHVEQDS